MDFPLIHLLISIVLFFFLLYLVVIPALQRISLIIFSRKFKVGGFSPVDYSGDKKVTFFDVSLTFVSFSVTLVLTMLLVVYAGKFGIIPEFPVKK